MADTPPEIVALANAAATIGAIYQWIDQIEEAGGATSISGVAKCNAFLASMKKNRARMDKLVMEPANAAVAQYKKERGHDA